MGVFCFGASPVHHHDQPPRRSREAQFTFIALNPARLLSKWYGESNKMADAYFSLAHKLAPTVLFIDEIDCLFRAAAQGAHEHEATSMLKAQFLSLWDGLRKNRSAENTIEEAPQHELPNGSSASQVMDQRPQLHATAAAEP